MISTQLLEFLEGTRRNQWLVIDGVMEVYVRKGYHDIGGVLMSTFDIANVTTQSEHRSSGTFTKLLNEVEKTSLPIFVENIMNERLLDFFVRRQYQIVSDGMNTHHAFKGGTVFKWDWIKGQT